MKTIIFGFVSSMFILFVVWTALAYQQYGFDLVNHHLNLEGMFIRIKSTWSTYNVYDDIKNLYTLSENFANYSIGKFAQIILEDLTGIDIAHNNDFIKFLTNFVDILISPINSILFGTALIIYITGSSLQLAITFIGVLLEVFGFVFNPMFI